MINLPKRRFSEAARSDRATGVLRRCDVVFSWNGLPQYAARLIRRAIEEIGCPCAVIGSRPVVPIAGMEEALGQDVIWIDETQPITWASLGLEPPKVFFQSGWGYRAFSYLGREVKSAGGTVACFSDANWRGDLRQIVFGAVGFRVLHKPFIDFMIVPGAQGRRLMRHFGVAPDRIFTGMYGADPAVFGGGRPLRERQRTFLYVGQFIKRKDVVTLATSFMRFAQDRPEWTLRLIGAGALRSDLPDHPSIRIENFLQPAELAVAYQQARFFVLPSLVEAWGLVVHEAALSGCALVLSDAVGSGPDLAGPNNALRFEAGQSIDLQAALHRAAGKSATWLDRAETASRELALQFGPETFAIACKQVIQQSGQL